MAENKIPDFRTPVDGALYMHSRFGLHFMPLRPNSKLPILSAWQTESLTFDATTAEHIYSVDSKGELHNFGIHPGPSGVFVVDVDCKGGKVGDASWSALQTQHGQAPQTFKVKTPTSGFHLYFRGTVEGQNTVIAKDVDTRAMNGYVVAPGSIIGDRRYEIIDASDIADAPQWLLDVVVPKAATVLDRPPIAQIDAPGEITRAVEYLKTAEPCVEGGTKINLYQVCCTMHDYGIALDTARELILDHYNDRCVPPWDMSQEHDHEHFEEKLRNAYNYAQNSLGAKTVEATTRAAIDDFKDVPPPAPLTDFATGDGEPAWLSKIHRFSAEEQFPDDDFFLSIADEGVIERGDVAVLQAKTKAGKSSALTAMMASMFVPTGAGRDFLGWRGDNSSGSYVLHFDTEQKPKDSQGLGRRALAMAGLQREPEWFVSNNIKGLSRHERRLAVDYFLRTYSAKGRILAVFIDGIGDLCDDTNNKELSEKLGEKVVSWTQHYGCAVITILHENPSAESQKMRGHLGTYLEMKAEAVFRLAKDEKGVFTLWAEKMRRGHIAKGNGPTWVWSKEAARPVSTIGARELNKLEAAEAFDSEKEKCEAFFDAELPAIGESRPATVLNEMAVKLKHEFGAKNQAARFVAKVRKLLGEQPSGFRIFKGPNTSGWQFERIAAPKATADEIAVLTS